MVDKIIESAISYGLELYNSGSVQYEQKKRGTVCDKIVYLDCSSFITLILTYGGLSIDKIREYGGNTKKWMEYAQKFFNIKSDVVFYVKNELHALQEQESILLQIKNSLCVGDVLIYRYSVDSHVQGHMLFYIGDNIFLHCTDIICSDLEHRGKGAIKKICADELFFNKNSYRYLFKNTPEMSVNEIAVIRTV